MILLLLADLDDAIAKDGEQILYIPEDLARFKKRTDGHVLVMGRKTFEATGALPNREIFVMTRQEREDFDRVHFVHSKEALEARIRQFPGKKVFLVGGATLVRELFDHIEEAFITRISIHSGGDRTIPPLDRHFTLVEETPIAKGAVEEHWIR
ncbi:MAG: dihydrofolate reductase [Peptoniphilus sp.]|nr:dihydrofolate reductase [Peptoniphilus sp.]MDD7363797.1 dihydrofolate reductase [Bacillota bacterium]MDY6044638.1 dihydrofolate reductase [Peptoniphilus sp.]